MGARDIKVRMALPEEGPTIGALEVRCGFKLEDWDLDWTDIGANWLVAEEEGRIVGAIQVSPAKPFGRLENLAVDPDLGRKASAVVARDLDYAGFATLRLAGCQAAIGVVPFGMESYKEVAEHRGLRELAQGYVMMKRLT